MYHSANGAAGCLHQYQTKAKTAQQGMTSSPHSHGTESWDFQALGFEKGNLVFKLQLLLSKPKYFNCFNGLSQSAET